MKIILTGGEGFLGKCLYKKLYENNHIIFSYDIIRGFDILDTEQLKKVFQEFEPQLIIHLAACSDLNIFSKNPDFSYKLNVIGTRNILDLCKKYNVRLLFASTCCCYGNNNVHPSDETSPIAPTEPYAQSKVESEKEILEVGLPHCCMRLATFYGPAMRPALAPAIFLDRSHKNKTIEIHGNGNQNRTLTYVDDIVNGIVTIAENDPKYTIINITTEEIISVKEMVEISKALTGNYVASVNIEDRPGQIYKEMIQSKRLQEFGWKPLTSFKEGMKNSYNYYKNNNNSW